MTQEEKIGQLCQVSGAEGYVPDHIRHAIQSGQVGSVINEVHKETINELQRIAIEESRLGIPLLVGRDVIHGFKTIFPIPLGQAASWNPEIVEQGAKVAAKEASMAGVNWTFAPMIDISRDPRWGRIAESLGEDPFLCAELGCAMVKGFQGDFQYGESIAACAKHFVGYGAAESGKDYCATNIPPNELRNVHMVPFKAASENKVATFMSSFSDIDGIPASGNKWLFDQVLRKDWQFEGFVVSDWESISQLSIHGLTENLKGAAWKAFDAGIDMEMVSTGYREHLSELLNGQNEDDTRLNQMVERILTAKFQLGLFDQPSLACPGIYDQLPEDHLQAAKQAAIESCVLLQNNNAILPLNKDLTNITVIGPLADDGYEQLGTWIFDGEERHSHSILSAIRSAVSQDTQVEFHRAMETSRSHEVQDMDALRKSVTAADVAILVLGEEAILSGEAHCRAELGLPGCQEHLVQQLSTTETPLILVLLAGRPLTLEPVLDKVDALLYAWHPGTMGGPAVAELLFGAANPSGKLPVTFPRKVGQIPIYYSQKFSGKPVSEHNFVHIDDIPVRAAQTSLGMAANHLDVHFTPQFPFGFGMSYSQFHYQNLQLSTRQLQMGETLVASVEVQNTSDREGTEVVQLYIHDRVASLTRPPKELKGFQRVSIKAGQTLTVQFEIDKTHLGFYTADGTYLCEPGIFSVGLGSNSNPELWDEFELIKT